MSENRCPSCRRELPVADGTFCPYCGAALAKGDELPEPVRAALDAAGKENDPVKKYRLLCDAREAFPNCLPIEEELLFLGRLHERDGKNPTFDVIKCFLLHPYLTPKEFTPQKRDAMRQELFHHEQLERRWPQTRTFSSATIWNGSVRNLCGCFWKAAPITCAAFSGLPPAKTRPVCWRSRWHG